MVEWKIRECNYCRPLVIFLTRYTHSLTHSVLFFNVIYTLLLFTSSSTQKNFACTLEQLNSTAMTKYKCLVYGKWIWMLLCQTHTEPANQYQYGWLMCVCFCSLESPREAFVQWNNVYKHFYTCAHVCVV